MQNRKRQRPLPMSGSVFVLNWELIAREKVARTICPWINCSIARIAARLIIESEGGPIKNGPFGPFIVKRAEDEIRTRDLLLGKAEFADRLK